MLRGIFWNMSGMVAVALTMLVTTPLFLQHFGAERFGILSTLWMVFGYFSVLDFGMGPAVVTFLSRPERQDGAGASGVFWTALLMNLAIGLVAGLGLVAVLRAAVEWGGNRPDAISGAIHAELTRAIPWMTVMLPVSLIYPILVGALDARRQFGIANANQVAGTIAAQVLPLLAVMLVRPTLTVAIVGTIAGRVLSAGFLLGFCVRRLGLSAPRFDRALVRPLMSYGGWVAVGSGAGSVLETADRVLVTGLLGGTAAAWYAIAFNVVTRVRVLPQAVMRALFPAVAGDHDAGGRALVRSARALALMLVPVLTVGMVALDPLCRLWIGSAAAGSVVPIARTMLIGVYGNCLAFIAVVALQARGQPSRLAKVHLWETPVFLLVMSFAIWRFGIIGAAAAWSLRLLADAAVLLWLTGMRGVLERDVLAQLPVPAAALAITLWLPGGWPAQLAAVLVLLAGWIALDTLLVRGSDRRQTALSLARALRQRVGGAL